MLPLVVYPLFGIATPAATFSNYANGTIFLFLGGFLIAAAIHRWHLDRRIALLTIRIFGTEPRRMVMGLMAATGFLSAWVSEHRHGRDDGADRDRLMGSCARRRRARRSRLQAELLVCLLLSIAYAASIGGMATLDRSPPNGIFARFVEQTSGRSLVLLLDEGGRAGDAHSAAAHVPHAHARALQLDLPGIPGGRDWVTREIGRLGPMSRGERVVLAVFLLALLWIFGPCAAEVAGTTPFKPLTDEVIAMGPGFFFMIPIDEARHPRFGLVESAKDVVAWDVLLLFGGSLTMAAALQSTGAAA